MRWDLTFTTNSFGWDEMLSNWTSVWRCCFTKAGIAQYDDAAGAAGPVIPHGHK